jgi:hypothetical protein
LFATSGRARQVALDHFVPICSLSSIHKLHALIGYLSFHTLGLSFYG